MSEIKWAYSMNQWNTYNNTARREQIERAMKVISVCGCSGVELLINSGRSEPLGRPELIELSFGSPSRFTQFLNDCSIEKVVSWYYDPGKPSQEENTGGRNPSDSAQHKDIVNALRQFAEYLKIINGEYLVVRPMNSYWKEAPVTDEKIKNAGTCWNNVGKMTREYGIKTVMHIDWLCAIHSEEDLGKLLAATDPELVGLTIDTAALTMVGLDPVVIYEKYADRVCMFHFKDVQVADTLDEYKTKFAENILQGGGQRNIGRWYWEMGEGIVDFPALMKSIIKHDYKGWIVIESDQSQNPAESALINNWYIKNVLQKI